MRCASKKIVNTVALRSQIHFSNRKYAASVDVTKSGEIPLLDANSYIDFKKFLRAHNVRHKEGYTCLQIECRLCDKQQQQSDRQLWSYVNKKTGSFYCPNCDISKSLKEALEILRTPEIRSQSVNVNYESKLSDLSPVTQEACDRLKLKGLRAEQLNAISVQYSPQEDLLHFPLKNAAQIVVGEKLLYLQDGHEETFQRASSSGSGILIHGSTSKSKAVLTSNLLDFIVLAATNQIDNHCIIGLPYALQQLPVECLPALENFKELVLWFNLDLTGWDAPKTFASKINEKRCLLIRPTEREPAPSVAFRQRLNLKHIIAKATPVLHQSITTFRSLRNDVLSELQNIEKVDGVKWKRFPVLNKLLKGHRKGELTILTGPTGSGKTTFISEYSLDLALQGVSTLWGSFEIRNSRLASTLLHQYVGYSLADKLNEFEHWANEFERLPLYFMTFHGQQPLKVVMEAVEHTQYAHDISHVIIDNLQFMMGISSSHRSDKYWEQDATVGAFRTFATKHNVHVTLVMHPRKERHEDDLTINSVFGTAKATQEADNVLIIQDKRLTSISSKKYLQIAKNRYNGELGIMPLEFDKNALSYARAKKKRDKEKTT